MKSKENFIDIKSLQISLLSPEDILHKSYGEVVSSKSINYKTMSAEKGGLFCECIFGPMKEYECRCGILTGSEHQGQKCSVCTVEVNTSRVRRYRLGHISLISSVPHVWFLKIKPFYLINLIGMKMKDIENILLSKYELNSTIRPRSVQGSLTNSRKYKVLQGKKVYHGSGCEIVHNYLSLIDLSYEYLYQRYLILNHKQNNRQKPLGSSYFYFMNNQYFLTQLKRLRILEYFLLSEKRPEWLFLKELPVLPPELRPFLLMENNLIVSSDLNFLYKRIIERNARLRDLSKLKQHKSQYALTSFYYSELCMLQHAVDSLIENGRRGKPIVSKKQIPLKSLTHILKGKDGRFRMNLLGKRVDLSGRSVISVGPRLKLTQCGLPIYIALVLFRSLIYMKLPNFSLHSKTILKNLLSKSRPIDDYFLDYLSSSHIIYDIDKIINSNPILLNRAPTLHKLNIQSFQPILMNSKSLLLHPLVCSSFNADFDGDQMAIHLPLSLSSQIESRILMMTYNNVVNSSNGVTIISPSQDIIFGLYYLTQIFNNSPIFNSPVYSLIDIRNFLNNKIVSLQTPIRYIVKEKNQTKEYITTPGRILLHSIIPVSDIEFIKINKVQTKKYLLDLLKELYSRLCYEDYLYFIDNLMAMGFYYAHLSGLSLSLLDISVPSLKPSLIKKASDKYRNYIYQKSVLLSTKDIKFYKENMIFEWLRAQENLTEVMMKETQVFSLSNEIPSIHMLVHSGARGSILQIRQISGIRGLMVKPSGELIEMPIKSNFKEGLTVIEYFYSTHGARKGVIDTSIRTATSGYLTRRLVHATQDLIISEEDCGTTRYIKMIPFINFDKLEDLSQLIGRICIIVKLDGSQSKLFYDKLCIASISEIKYILVRTPLTCESKDGICRNCYGSNLSNHYLISIGEAIGIIAAQSIGEPGTQLTMRTFHMGGVSLAGQTSNVIRSSVKGRVCIKYGFNTQELKTFNYTNFAFNSYSELFILDENDLIIQNYKLPLGALLYIFDGEYIQSNQILFRWNPDYEPIFYTGTTNVKISYEIVKINDIYIKILCLRNIKTKKLFQKFIETSKERSFNINILIPYTPKDLVIRDHDDLIQPGEILLLIPRSTELSGDITGGLSKISHLFESSNTGRQGAFVDKNGLYLIKPINTSTGIKWITKSLNNTSGQSIASKELFNFKTRTLSFLRKGDSYLYRVENVLEKFKVFGLFKGMDFLKKEIQSIYKANGVSIHDKHLELIIRRMFSKIEITYEGYTPYVNTELVDIKQFIHYNLLSLAKALPLAKGKVSMRGITSVSLESRSFLSAASFQNTAQVLTFSSVTARIDNLSGLGENVILGRLIPVGSGSFIR